MSWLGLSSSLEGRMGWDEPALWNTSPFLASDLWLSPDRLLVRASRPDRAYQPTPLPRGVKRRQAIF